MKPLLAFFVLPLLYSCAYADEIKVPTVTATVDLSHSSNKPDSAPMVVDEATKKQLDDLATAYEKVAKDNFLLIIKTLKADGRQHSSVHIVLTYAYGGVAATSNSEFGKHERTPTIVVSAKYALAHPGDLGMIVHEMVHVVQAYPRYDPGWLVEGIADYVRWFFYEPVSKRPHPNPKKATARDAYQTTAAFLYWAANKYNQDLVPKLNEALRANRYEEGMFKDLTGKTLDELNTEWRDFLSHSGERAREPE